MKKRERIDFDCGCSISFFVVGGNLRNGLACCRRHEAPNQTLDRILERSPLVIQRSTVDKEDIAVCECGVRIASRIVDVQVALDSNSQWYHANPKKPNYQQYHCYPVGSRGSSSPFAEPKGKITYARKLRTSQEKS